MSENNDTQIQGDDDRESSRRLSLQGNRPPAEIEGYSIVRRLGTGAYGAVWLAREDRTGRMVAVKFYPHRRGLNWSMLSREVEKLAAVYTSRNIVRLLDVGWNAEPPYFVMEFVENGSLGNYLARGALSVDESIRIIREVCSALIDAHGAGVLHCDLKPDNVLLDAQMHARICDFGQARMSHEQSPALGTLYYMAPEQADLEALPDARWDVYAIGALLYHMITGQPPHRTPEIQRALEHAGTLEKRLEIYRQLVTAAGLPKEHRSVKGVDTRLAELIEQCLAVHPSFRYPNAQAVLDEIEARDRQKARRPLLLLGFLVLVVLTAAMVPVFVNALSRNLKVTEQQITQRALESDALSARLQAAALEDELNTRLEELQSILEVESVRQELELMMKRPVDEVVTETYETAERAFAERPKWMQLLDAAWERSNRLNETRQRGQDTSWFLTDATGIQIWRRDYSPVTLGVMFSYRDYFHGLGQDFDANEVPADVKPLSAPHVSVAYKSTTTGRQTVALSVPVRDSAGNIIGIFARTAHLGDLQARLRGRMMTSAQQGVHRVIALAEVRDAKEVRLLDHPCLTEDFVQEAERANTDLQLFAQLRMDADSAARIASAKDKDGGMSEVLLESYVDPVSSIQIPQSAEYRGDWMAALAPIRNTPWMVIVQEHRESALLPVQTMAQKAKQQAWLAVLIAPSLVGMVWFFVWQASVKLSPRKLSPAERKSD
ncbi:MAG: protein kinase [Planctomycetaceae bacterium]|nr:protein kinase [Planctomycetaceae bacterium]